MYKPWERAEKIRKKRLEILSDPEKYKEYCEQNRKNKKGKTKTRQQ
ncbi:MAG: hypothetical protein AB7D26_10585 [Marinobacterium sp.]|jgi:hypothetical protein